LNRLNSLANVFRDSAKARGNLLEEHALFAYTQNFLAKGVYLPC
jgi:hypothetical protein